jgi:integrase
MKINAANERIKYEYFSYLKEANQLGTQSIDAVAKALDRFETYTGRTDFKRFRREQAVAFKTKLASQLSARSGEKLSKATVRSTLLALKAFFLWLAREPGYRNHLQYDDGKFFNMSLKDTAIANAAREPRVPTLEQVRAVILGMPAATVFERRNRAVIAFILLTGARDDAAASMRLKHVDLAQGKVFQDAREVRTKFSKSFPTFFFPVGDDIVAMLADWIASLHSDHGFGLNDPLFPPTRMGSDGNGGFVAIGFEHQCWTTAAPIRAIFKVAFEGAGLCYFNPHSVRKTLTRLGMGLGLGDDGMKAWSQNLGHDDVQTTYRSYGHLPSERQGDLIRAAAHANEDDRLALELGRAALAAARVKQKV